MGNLVNIHKVIVTMVSTILQAELWSVAKDDKFAQIGAKELKSVILEKAITATFKKHNNSNVTVYSIRDRVEILGENSALIIFKNGDYRTMSRKQYLNEW